MSFKEALKCVILECQTLISDAIDREGNISIDEYNDHSSNIWTVIRNEVSDSLNHSMKTERTFTVVLLQISNFRSWFEDSVYKEIVGTLHQIQEGETENDKTAFLDVLKLAVVKRQFIIFEKITLHTSNEEI